MEEVWGLSSFLPQVLEFGAARGTAGVAGALLGGTASAPLRSQFNAGFGGD